MAQLKTRNVFLDTQVFFDSGFNYKRPPLSTLALHAANGDARVFLTDVTVEEVKAHIREQIQASLQAHQSFSAKSKILHNSSSSDVITTISRLKKPKLVKELVGQFEAFLKDAKATILKAGNMKAESVLAAYFGQKPPFGHGKKKSEFPDAFAIAALGEWCSQEGSVLYVVSGDGDMQAACNDDGPLYCLPRLADFLDALASHLQQKTTEFVRSQIVHYKAEIIERVTKAFPDRGFIITDVADFNSDVEDVRVTDVDLEDDDFDVIDVSADSATITASLCIHYEADLVYGNEDTASYDHEDGYFFFDDVNKTVEREDDFEVQVDVVFDDHDPDSFEVEHVHLEAPQMIEIQANEGNGWPYK